MHQILKHWFLIGLISAIAIGYLFSTQLAFAANSAIIRSGLVASVLFLMGLGFSASALFQAVRRPLPASIAVFVNVLAIPALAFLGAKLLPPNLGGGLIVAAAVPCTLASASLWTRRAGGDDTISMLVTVFTNFFCFLITPFTLWMLLGKTADIQFADQVWKLAILVVAPLASAQFLLRSEKIRALATEHKKKLGIGAQIGILAMVTIGGAASSHNMLASGDGSAAFANQSNWIALMIGIAASIHILALIGGHAISNAIRLERPKSIAVAIAGSQKTLMVGLQIAIDCGVSMLPMIAYHVCQLIIDTIIADKWSRESGTHESSDEAATK